MRLTSVSRIKVSTSPSIMNTRLEAVSGVRFWQDTLGSPSFLVAPMVDASELAWRLLSRRHGAQLCYTPMLHSAVFVRDSKYRRENLVTCSEDRPLIAQFCGNDPQLLLQAALLAQPQVDAIDINLGCPQAIARRGHYGAFLQDDWPLLTDIVSTLHSSLTVPVTCKIRVYEDINKTVAYARLLEAAGCQMLTVHGRTREQKGPLTGMASWDHIRAVRESVKIPVMANGNIQCLADLTRCMEETRCMGVMTAEGNLYNPALFEGCNPPAWEMALEYLDLVDQYPCPTSYIRGHLFKLFQQCLCLPENVESRSQFATGSGVTEFRKTVLQLRNRYLGYHEGTKLWPGNQDSYDLVLPPWLCQSYVRIPPEEHLKKLQDRQNRNADVNQYGEGTSGEQEKENLDGALKRQREASVESTESRSMTKRKMRRLRKLKHKPESAFHCRRTSVKCTLCPNPMGTKCESQLCRGCCRSKCYIEDLNCEGHGIYIQARREKARFLTRLEQEAANLARAADSTETVDCGGPCITLPNDSKTKPHRVTGDEIDELTDLL